MMTRMLFPLACLLAISVSEPAALAAPLAPGDIYRIDFTTNPAGWSVPEGCGDILDGPPCPPDTFSLTFFGDSLFSNDASVRLSLYAGSDLLGNAEFDGNLNLHAFVALSTESSPPANPVLEPLVGRIADAGWNDAVLSGCLGCHAELEIITGLLTLDESNLEIAVSRKNRHGDGYYFANANAPVPWFEVSRQGVVPEPPVTWLLVTAGAAGIRRRLLRFRR